MAKTERIFSLLVATVLSGFCALSAAFTPLFAQSTHNGTESTTASAVTIIRISETVTLDGMPDEPFWQSIDPLPLTMREPTHRAPLTEHSEIRIAHDASYLYLSGRLYDSDPTGIRVNSMYRDQSRGDDIFGLLINPYDDNDIGLVFWTTPAGVRGDAEVPLDAQAGFNDDWNTYWDVETRTTQDGWFVEMRIPFSSLGFQVRAGRVPIAFTTYRYISRKNERQIFPDIAPEYNYLRSSLAYSTVLEGIESHRPVYLTPYVLGGAEQASQLNASASGYELDDNVEGQFGGDLKYNVTNNLTLDLTANTDFAQVEADDWQVNLTRYPLFFPEKRQFFLERSGIFDFLTGGSTRLFHSRQIGLADGEPVRIIGGARLVGRAGEWDLGVLNMQSAESPVLPSENFGVLRARRRIINANSNAGAMLTTRLGVHGTYNVGYGFDNRIHLYGDDYVTLQWAQTLDDEIIGNRGFRFAPSALARVTYYRARSRGLTYWFSGRYQGEDYLPRMGFTSRQNVSDFFYWLAYFHYPKAGPFRRIDPFQLFGNVVLRNHDGSVESAFVEHDFDLNWRSGASLGLDLELYYDNLRDPLDFPEHTTIPTGRYTYPRFEFDYNMAPGDLLRASAGGGVQKFYDGWRVNLWAGPVWNLSRYVGLNAQYRLDRVRFPDRNEGFDSHLLRLRSNFALNTKLSVNAFLQFSSTDDFSAANIRFRYNFREGNDLWIVYNEGWNLDLDRTSPSLPRTDSRTLLVKYTYTFAQ